ncbi:unnamed protein product [Acanthoscelides obtectus]|nr:unnamed protein product [Acanthoscelides obtectus]CAK1647554.1 Glycogen-binding subunit 76A [Acanthoscelides obtectus]
MTSNGEKCGISSLLPISCRGRAEAFARSLHTRLKNLGSHNENNTDESSWLAAHENSIATSQPRQVLDFCLFEPTGSPEDPEIEIEEKDINRRLNGDSLLDSGNDDCLRPSAKNLKCSSDSDSDVFYDIENDSEQEYRLENGNTEEGNLKNGTNSEVSKIHLEAPLPEKQANRINSEVSKSELEEVQLNEINQEAHETNENGTNESAGDGGGEKGGGTESPESYDEVTERLNGSSTQEEFHSLTDDVSDKLSSLSLRDEDCNSDSVDVTNEKPCDIEGKDRKEDCSESSTAQQSTTEIRVNGSPAEEKERDSSEEDEDRPRVRRCSSLKTGKTPPGTPGRKKIVRFADALGLDLADVRTFLDEIPKVPTSAYEDLSVDLTDSPSDTSLDNKLSYPKPEKVLMPLFQQPGGLSNFLDLVRDNFVCLENAIVDDPFLLTIKGFVRVRNLDFHKSVYVRYTLNSWKSYADVQATYVANSCDGFSDKFSFVIYAHSLSVGQRLELACRFQCKGCQYWDNNNGRNYCFQCLPVINHTSTTPITTGLDWGNTASFY